jgi:hypothetical protein
MVWQLVLAFQATPGDPAENHNLGAAVSLQASVYLLRGQAYHALDNRVRAVMW